MSLLIPARPLWLRPTTGDLVALSIRSSSNYYKSCVLKPYRVKTLPLAPALNFRAIWPVKARWELPFPEPYAPLRSAPNQAITAPQRGYQSTSTLIFEPGGSIRSNEVRLAAEPAGVNLGQCVAAAGNSKRIEN
jgi:hypothetical protein